MALVVEHMITNLAAASKNARVKQLILEKVESLLSEDVTREDEALSIFKQ